MTGCVDQGDGLFAHVQGDGPALKDDFGKLDLDCGKLWVLCLIGFQDLFAMLFQDATATFMGDDFAWQKARAVGMIHVVMGQNNVKCFAPATPPDKA